MITGICFVVTWVFILSLVWGTLAMIQDTIRVSQKLHQIPCANCQFFTDSYYLKCPVHPSSALTEEAINCMDYEPQFSGYYQTEPEIY